MKRITCIMILTAILLASVIATAGPALMNMRIHHGEVPARTGHSLPHLQLPGWYPH